MELKTFFKAVFILLFMSGLSQFSSAQNENRFIRQGNKAYEAGDFKKAEIDYRKALDKNQKSMKGEYNLGGAIYEQQNFDEARRIYEQLASANLPANQKAMTYHNLGNSFLQMQKPEQAIEAYKNALRHNPGDIDTKYNLEFAKKMLKQQQQQNQDQNKDQQNKDQNKEDQQQNQQQQEQNKEQEQNQQNQQQNQQNQQQNQDNQAQQPQTKQISKQDAERMLQALQDNEKKTMEKIKLEKLKNANRVKTEKDW